MSFVSGIRPENPASDKDAANIARLKAKISDYYKEKAAQSRRRTCHAG